MAASERVFSIPELHEAILLCLDMREVLLAQRVSREWQTATAYSIKLQRKLFFASPPGAALRLVPVPASLFRASNLDRKVAIVQEIELNPLLNRLMKVTVHQRKRIGIGLQMEYGALGSKDASWRSMQVTSPPVAMLWLLLDPIPGVLNHIARPVKGDGLTIGALVDSLRNRFGIKLDGMKIFIHASRGWIPGTC